MLKFDDDILKWLVGALLVVGIVAFLTSCGTYQPPGEDLWLAL